MSQGYRTQLNQFKKSSAFLKQRSQILRDQLNNIKYYNKVPFKLFINKHPLCHNPRPSYSITSLSCTSALIKPYTRLVDDFNKLYGRRAFIHYYTQAGMELDEFNEALEDLYTLIKDYEVTTWDYNNFDIGEEEEEEEEDE